MSQRVEVMSNLRVRKNLGEGSTHGLSTLTFVRTFSSFTKGIEAWSSFAVLTATQYAIDLCKAVGVEVPDLSGEVKRLVSAWE